MGSDSQHGNLACSSAKPPPASTLDPDRSATTVRLVNKRESGTDEEIATSPFDLTEKHVIAKSAEGRNDGGRRGQTSLEIRCGPVVAESVKHRVGPSCVASSRIKG